MMKYAFTFEDGKTLEFPVEEGVDTSSEAGLTDAPDWMELENYRCKECGIPAGERKTCPAILAIKPVIDSLDSHFSYEKVHLVFTRDDIRMETDISIQRALRSLIGFLLPFSSCPVMMKLRPMAYFHLPLGSKDHTAFRFIGMYLTAQYLRQRANLSSDWELEQLLDLFRKIHMVNRGLANRIRVAAKADATVNGIVLLDAFADSVEVQVEELLEEMKPFFSTYLSD